MTEPVECPYDMDEVKEVIRQHKMDPYHRALMEWLVAQIEHPPLMLFTGDSVVFVDEPSSRPEWRDFALLCGIRARKVFARLGIQSYDDLENATMEMFLNSKGFGPTSERNLRENMLSVGLVFKK